MSFVKKNRTLIIFLLILIGWVVFLSFVSPEEIIKTIGINNGYLVAFVVALLGGVSTLTAGSFYLLIITLALGGLNPILLGIVTGPALTVGDGIFFFLGSKAVNALPKYFKDRLVKLSQWINGKYSWLIPILIYFYAGFSLLPGDILMLVLALADYPFKKTIIPLFLGNITLITIMAYLTIQGAKILS